MTDPLIDAARFLQSQLEWMRHATADNGEAYAVAAFAEIDWCAGRLRGLVNGPAEQKYLGPCGAPTQPTTCDHPYGDGTICGVCGRDVAALMPVDGPTCEGDIYAPRGAKVGRCRTCGATVPAAEREAWLDGEVRAHAFRAAQIADAYRVNVNTIRSWALRGHLIEHGRDRDDRPLYNVGDVLNLAAADAARRETERAKRARRASTTREDAA